MNNNWVKNSSSFFLQEVSEQTKHLPVGVYKLNITSQGQLYLDLLQDKFDFPFKIYGIEQKLIGRVKRTFDNTGTNLGILLNGIKGTGKTVTAKQICNVLGLPVILVNADLPGLVDFINAVQQDAVIFFDEFEKTFPRDYRADNKLLTVMDGVLNSEHRKVFLLTTNNTYIEDSFIQRPGRIRYLKTFGNLDIDSIMEIIDDKLEKKNLRQEVIRFVSELELITVDIVSAIVQEVNIHGEAPEEFSGIFNVKKAMTKFDVYKTVYDEDGAPVEKLVAKNARIAPIYPFTKENESDYFYLNGDDIGVIDEVVRENLIVVQLHEDEEEQVEGEVQVDKPEKDNQLTKMVTYRIEPVYTAGLAFGKYLDL